MVWNFHRQGDGIKDERHDALPGRTCGAFPPEAPPRKRPRAKTRRPIDRRRRRRRAGGGSRASTRRRRRRGDPRRSQGPQQLSVLVPRPPRRAEGGLDVVATAQHILHRLYSAAFISALILVLLFYGAERRTHRLPPPRRSSTSRSSSPPWWPPPFWRARSSTIRCPRFALSSSARLAMARNSPPRTRTRRTRGGGEGGATGPSGAQARQIARRARVHGRGSVRGVGSRGGVFQRARQSRGGDARRVDAVVHALRRRAARVHDDRSGRAVDEGEMGEFAQLDAGRRCFWMVVYR